MDRTIKDLYRVYLKPNVERRELWRCTREGNRVTIVFYNGYGDMFEDFVLEPNKKWITLY